jgi:hypothetical protein
MPNEVSIRMHSLKTDKTGLAIHGWSALAFLDDGHAPSTILSTFVEDRRNPLHRSSLSTAVSMAGQRQSIASKKPGRG